MRSFPSPSYVMKVEPGKGYSNSNGLIIECPEKPGPQKYFYIAQEIDGLKPNQTYEVNYHFYSDKDTSVTPDSVYMVLGLPWQTENNESGRIFSQKIESEGWISGNMKLINRSGNKATFMIVVNDITHNLRLDDISIKESE